MKKLWRKFTTWLDLIIARGELDSCMNACRKTGGESSPYFEQLQEAFTFYDQAKWEYDNARSG